VVLVARTGVAPNIACDGATAPAGPSAAVGAAMVAVGVASVSMRKVAAGAVAGPAAKDGAVVGAKGAAGAASNGATLAALLGVGASIGVAAFVGVAALKDGAATELDTILFEADIFSPFPVELPTYCAVVYVAAKPP